MIELVLRRKIVIFSRRKISLIFLLISIILSSCKPTQNLLIDYQIKCDETQIDKDELASFVRQKPNRKTFGMRLYMAVYKLVDQDKEKIREEKRAIKLAKINEKRKKKYDAKVAKYDTKEKSYRKYVDKYKDSIPSRAQKYLQKAEKYEKLKKIRFNEKEKISSFTQWLLEIGEAPVIYDKYLTRKTRNQMNIYLKNKGYFNAVVSDSIILKRKRRTIETEYFGKKQIDTIKRVTVVYSIALNQPYTIDSLEYQIDNEQILKLITENQTSSLLKRGKNLDIDVLQEERSRINDFLKLNGFYKFSKEYVFYNIDTMLGNKKVKIITGIKQPINELTGENEGIHHKFKISNVYIYPDFNPKEALEKQAEYYSDFDTTEYELDDTQHFYFVTKEPSSVKFDAISKSIYIYRDSIYNTTNIDDTYKHLGTMSVFKLNNIEMYETDYRERTFVEKMLNEINKKSLEAQNIVQDSAAFGYLNCNIKLTRATVQSTTIELEGTNTSGNIGAAGNFIYQHKNFFKRSELLDFRFKTAFEKQINNITVESKNLFNTFEYGTELSIEFPRLFLFSRFKSELFQKRYNPKTNFSLSFNYQERPDYTRLIANIGFGYLWKTSPYVTHFITPLSFNSVVLKNPTPEFEEYIAGLRIKESYENHLIASFNYSFIFNNQGMKGRKNFWYFRFNTETAGNSITAFMKTTNQEKSDGSYLFPVFNIVYAQYFKTDADIRFYQPLNDRNILVLRAFGGVGVPYGNIKLMPFGKQYFSGGANSIRAWQVRSLGPGTYILQNDTIFPNQSADIKLEANIEYRKKLFWVIEGALFFDIGNIWAVNNWDNRQGARFRLNEFYKEIAMGTGFGVRFDFSFFVFRFDFGTKVKDPQQTEGNRWVFGKDITKTKSWTFNIGIGYPF